jgi:salicylate hydroxylase
MIHASLESPVWNATVVRDGLTGKVLSETNMDWDKMPFKVPAYLNHRVALHRELMRLATAHSGQGDEPAIPGNPAELRTSSQAVDIDADTGTVTLEDGTKMQADLLVVADGINSSLRSKILGRPHPAQPSGSTAFRLLLPLSALQADPDLTEWTNTGQLSVRFGKGRSIVAYSCRMDGTDLLNVAALCPDDELPKDHLDAGWMAAGEKELMLSVFKDCTSMR